MNKKIAFLVAGAALIAAACSFDVNNPGPVQDAALDDPGAFTAIVRGAQYNVARAVGLDAFYGAVAAKEYSTAGRVNATKLPAAFGQLTVDDISASTWNWSQAGRWQAEDGQRRLREVLGASFATNRFASQLLLYGAIANRILGENFCEAVIDGAGKTPINDYFTRAEAEATEAIAVAGAITPNTAADVTTKRLAYVVRASARLYLRNFAGAGADAAAANTGTTESLSAPFDATTKNVFVDVNDFAVGGSFRALSVYRSYFEAYFRNSGDLRVRWDSSVAAGTTIARKGEDPNVPWYYPRKYIPNGTTADFGTPIRLTGSREARLIEAEVALRGGDFTTEATILNALHTGLALRAGSPALPNWAPTTIQQGWDALRRERSIELWLEGRTMGDLRRWAADGTYQTYFGAANGYGADSDVADRIRLCLPIARGERNTNPNLSLTPDDPISPIFNNAVAPW